MRFRRSKASDEQGDDVELISDGHGLAIVGEPSAVERFMEASGLAQLTSRDLGTALRAGSTVLEEGSKLSANSGRWVKLTKESARHMKKYGATPTDTPGVSHAMAGARGSIKKWLQIETTPQAMATNPVMLSNTAGVMAQMAMQQAIDEITDYLAAIDEKLDDVLRAQTNQVLARLDGVDLAVREAMSVRDSVGRVSEVTWSKVQNLAQVIHETQGYALRQLADIADKLDEARKIDELADVAEATETDVKKWIVVLARCFELHDSVAVLELDRVLDASPSELDRHRLGLQAARQDRLQLITERTDDLLARIREANDTANAKVLFNPRKSPVVNRSSKNAKADVESFRAVLGVGDAVAELDERSWTDAAKEGIGHVKERSGEAFDQALSAGNRVRGASAEAAKTLGRTARDRVTSKESSLSADDDQSGGDDPIS